MKKIFLISLPTLLVIAGIVDITLTNNSTKMPQAPTQSNNMDSMHQAQAASSNTFTSLLNKPAPDFSLQTTDGKDINLKDLRGKKVVLFFTEGLMCYPACWNQIVALGKDKNLNNDKIVTLSIAVDQASDWQSAFKQMPDLASGTILADTTRSVSTNYGVMTLPSSMHKGQYPGHTYVIVDEKGIIRYEFDDPDMGVRNDQLVKELAKIK